MSLSQEQLEAVNSNSPLILCGATAGSGKSRVIVERIKRLINDGVPASKIAAISFTTTGSKVLQERLEGIRLGVNSTLHAWMLKLLQKHGQLIGLPGTIGVLDEDAANEMLEATAKEMRVECSLKGLIQAVAIVRTPGGVQAIDAKTKKLMIVCQEFSRKQHQTGELDFDLILFYGHKLIVLHPETISLSHLHVDEGQDSSVWDWKIYNALPIENKMVSGDDSQAVFGFRGGCLDKFIEFSRKATVLNLSTNYRSATSIIEASSRLISHNINRIPNLAIPRENAPVGGVDVREFANANEELAFIANQILKTQQQNESKMAGAAAKKTKTMGEKPQPGITEIGGHQKKTLRSTNHKNKKNYE